MCSPPDMFTAQSVTCGGSGGTHCLPGPPQQQLWCKQAEQVDGMGELELVRENQQPSAC